MEQASLSPDIIKRKLTMFEEDIHYLFQAYLFLLIIDITILCAVGVYYLSIFSQYIINNYMNPSQPVNVLTGFLGIIFGIFMLIGYMCWIKEIK